MTTGYYDLHCHWLPGIDDGVTCIEDGIALLRGLASLGFSHVTATPHMRPGLFDNSADDVRAAFATFAPQLASEPGLPAVAVAAEHFFDDLIFEALLEGRGVPYSQNGRAFLIELPVDGSPPLRWGERFFDLRCRGIRPVLAHPERYSFVAQNPAVLEPLLDGGTLLLLDVAALVGKYGRRANQVAHRLLEEGYYYAACSDAHHPLDVELVSQGIEQLERLLGREETEFFLAEGPRRIVEGTVEE